MKPSARSWRTLKETSRMTGYSVSWLRKLIDREKLRTHQRAKGCEHRIPLAEVHRLTPGDR